MADVGHIAEATACDSKGCYTNHLLVRGTRVSFVSTEQVKRVGKHKLNDRKMPSDIRIPPSFALVHDTVGELLTKCDLYVLRARSGGSKNAPESVLDHAREYFVTKDGMALPIGVKSVEIPEGPWKRLAKVSFIRYFRPGFDQLFEHEYEVPVDLFDCVRPLSWRLPLPSGCVVDSRGFVWP